MGIIDRLFLVKEIVSRTGRVHFRRWRLAETRWFSIYVHQIAQSDEERDPHDHPWAFVSWVLRGGYSEVVRNGQRTWTAVRKPGRFAYHPTSDFHKLTLLTDTAWTLVLTGPRTHNLWGYLTEQGWVDHITYRAEKNATRSHLRTVIVRVLSEDGQEHVGAAQVTDKQRSVYVTFTDPIKVAYPEPGMYHMSHGEEFYLDDFDRAIMVWGQGTEFPNRSWRLHPQDAATIRELARQGGGVHPSYARSELHPDQEPS